MRKVSKGLSSRNLVGNVLVVFFILLIDQLSKFAVVEFLRLGGTVRVLSFFNIIRVENKGITFGLLSGTLQPIILILVSLIIIISLCVGMRGQNRQNQLAICMIIGGAIGNVIDRFIHKAVIDFLDFHLLTYHWPAFNIADSAIVIGVLILCLISREEEGA
ncbi:MAG: signal peptidase II [Holosporaceae bacterium]|nr:signal peptidase II [Holosporaceae bacterium]